MTRDGMVGTARQMRKEPTAAERVLWLALRRKSAEGMRFRRQRVIGPYIVDICCLEHRVIVEVDGSHHLVDDVTAYDEERTRYLDSFGFQVLRFGNDAVMGELGTVLESIVSAGQNPYPIPFTAEEADKSGY